MLGSVFSLLSAFALSVCSVAAKKALRKEHSLDFSIFANILGVLLLLPFIGFIDFNIDLLHLGLIYIASFFGVFAFWFSIRALRHIEISVEAPLANLSVVFTALLGYLILGEKLGGFDMLGIFLLFLGAYLIEVNHGGVDLLYPFREFKNSKYIHYLLLGVIFSSLATITDRLILKETPVMTYLFFVYLFLTINHIALFFLFHRKDVPLSIIYKEAKDSIGWAILFSIARLISSFFMALALTMLYAALVVALKRLSVLLSIVLGGSLFHEKQWKWRMGSAMIMLLGILLIIFV
ncbi:MAG: DMT family transporter [Candidatus Azambacteria bacterium]|nr:DMT family transporter [Candidatus Azambacteria bacterium]